jgi:hypothetical protein
MADINADHLRSALLQQAIGETACTLAHIQTPQTFNLSARDLQSPFELETTARHVARFGVIKQLQGSAFRHLIAVFHNGAPRPVGLLPLDAPGDQSLCLRTRSGQAALDEKLINAHSVGF